VSHSPSRTAGRVLVAALALAAPARAEAHTLPFPGPLSEVPIPPVPGLLDGRKPLVVDRDAAVALGKALFWDEAVGSDGMACASCHFHAGADARVRNAVGPGPLHAGATGTTFEALVSGEPSGPNRELRLADFPLLVLANPADRTSLPIFLSDDVVSSAGTFGGDFADAIDAREELCTGGEDPIFVHGAVRTRRVEPRHTPSVVNAVFSHRQFADGRASNHFNGRNESGERDRTARILVAGAGGVARRTKLRLPNASLASQAVAPPVDDREMACSGRSFAALGRKLLAARPLATQAVHPDDSVLAPLRDAGGLGLEITYRELVERAFHPRLWSARRGPFGAPPGGAPYDHAEANFSLFFGLAIQLYESTLVSDQAPYDLSPRSEFGLPYELPLEALRGLDLFMGKAHCVDCHKGSEFTAASVTEIAPPPQDAAADGPRHAGHRVAGLALVDRIAVAGGDIALLDRGFASTGVAPSAHDRGVGGTDAEGRPFSFAVQYAALLAGGKPADRDALRQISACSFALPFSRDFLPIALSPGPITPECAGRSVARVPTRSAARREAAEPGGGRLRAASAGVFKIPTLRNVELTGPYMHNGGLATLRQVIDFYDRGGNFDEVRNPELHPFVAQIALSEQERSDLEAFLRTLTDERVRWERAPFDHPALRIPNGHVEVDGELTVTPLPGRTAPLGTDAFLDVPAVGREGRTPEQGPLLPFSDRVED
jgi:cytochrome c peroxidase